tara:strand:+ start:1384 stop:2052 length:669 start_codon:yes stop_codon:yes gene_type:complete
MIKQKKKLILLGDSVFDNIAYLDRDEKSVTQHLQSKLDTSLWDITVEAVDGATTKTIISQYNKAGIDVLDNTNTTIVVSIGGNDALNYINSLDKLTLEILYDIKKQFYSDYYTAISHLSETGQQLYICTIYNPKLPDPVMQKRAEAGLSIFNDIILTTANDLWEDYLCGYGNVMMEVKNAKYPLIDLRNVCRDDKSFANAIEPSGYGGDKITNEIIHKVLDT